MLLLLLGALLPAGCSTTVPVAESTLAARAPVWVAVVPRTVRASSEFTRLVEARRAEYEVHVVEYDPEANEPAQALAHVRSTLARLRAGGSAATSDVAGYVLLVGTARTLPMGPWHFEGIATPILTDFPLVAGLETTTQPIPAAQWREALTRAPQWFVGRIPFDEPAAAVRMLGAILNQMQATTDGQGSALLGAEGICRAWMLASAREALRKMGWTAALAGSTGSCNEPAPHGFLPLWDRDAPRITILAASTMPTAEGEGLRAMLPGASAREPDPGTPPALMVAFAEGFGDPTNDVMRSLFDRGWAAGGVAFTTPVSAQPLVPAWRLVGLLPADLASGAPLGNALEACRLRYWVQAGDDVGMILPGMEEHRALNTLGAVAYGDPALRAIDSKAPPAPPIATGLPLVVPSRNGSETSTSAATGTPDSGAERTPAQSAASPTQGVNWVRIIAVGALGIFLLAMLLWLLARRSDRRAPRR